MPTLNEIRKRFSRDRFATEATGIVITAAAPGYAKAELLLTERHKNCRGTPMGGAIFTLADFAAAVAANGFADHTDTVSLHADITFLSTAKGSRLIAEANCVKQGRATAFYEVEVRDETGRLVARAGMNGFVLEKAEETS